jgi:hypothetical protein
MEREYRMLKFSRLIRVEDNGKLVSLVDHSTYNIGDIINTLASI